MRAGRERARAPTGRKEACALEQVERARRGCGLGRTRGARGRGARREGRGGGGAWSPSCGARGGAGGWEPGSGREGRAGRGGFAVPRLGLPAGAHSFTRSRSRARERRRRQDEQYQERAGAGAEPQAGPQPGGRAGAVRQDPGERRAAGGGGLAGGALSPVGSLASFRAGPPAAPRSLPPSPAQPLTPRPPRAEPPRAQVNRKRAPAPGPEVRLGTEVAGSRDAAAAGRSGIRASAPGSGAWRRGRLGFCALAVPLAGSRGRSRPRAPRRLREAARLREGSASFLPRPPSGWVPGPHRGWLPAGRKVSRMRPDLFGRAPARQTRAHTPH